MLVINSVQGEAVLTKYLGRKGLKPALISRDYKHNICYLMCEYREYNYYQQITIVNIRNNYKCLNKRNTV